MPKPPIDSFSGELVTILEFVRVAVTKFPKATDKILTHMDLSDEALIEEAQTLGAQVDYDFNDDGDDE